MVSWGFGAEGQQNFENSENEVSDIRGRAG